MRSKKKWLVTIEIQEDHEFAKRTEEYILLEPIEIGHMFKGGKVISCNELKRIAEDPDLVHLIKK